MRKIKLFQSSILAGIAIGVGSLLYIIAQTYGNVYLGAALFSLGLLTICLNKWHLYTGKIGFIFNFSNEERDNLPTWSWLVIIFIGNALGAFLIGMIIHTFTLIDSNSVFSTTVKNIGEIRNTAVSVKNTLLMYDKSVMCGTHVAFAVGLFNYATKRKNVLGQLLGIFVPIFLFVLCGYQHCIANMVYMAASGLWTINSAINLLSCILGNTFGAILAGLVCSDYG